MSEETVHFTIGKNLPTILLNIVQTHILNNRFDKAESTYMDSVIGFTKEYYVKVLKNELAFVVEDDDMVLTDDPNVLKENKSYIFSWDNILEKRFSDIICCSEHIDALINEMHSHGIKSLKKIQLNDNYPIESKIATNIFRGSKFKDDNLYDFVNEYLFMEDEYYDDNPWLPAFAEYALSIYELYEYMKSYYELNEYLFNSGIYLFNNPKEHYRISNTIDIIKNFINFMNVTHNSCKAQQDKLKENFKKLIAKYEILQNVFDGKLCKCNIEDGYDAGWLAPNGDFYGADGPTSAFIHLNLADKIYDLLYKDISRYDSVFKVLRDTDEMLCNMGWMKIHHSDCYGYFAHSKKDDEYYNPTKQQIDAICKYGNKFYNGKISTAPMTSRTTKCSDILQMDEIALHKEFTRI